MRLRQLACGVVVGALMAGASVQAARAGARDNVLVVGSPDDPSTLDPANGIAGSDIPYLYTLYDRLLSFDPATLEPRPMLAESFSWQDDRTLVLHLRHGVRFHDGAPFDAAAVKASLEHYQAAGKQADLQPVTAIETPDEFTVVLKVRDSYSALPAVLTDRAGMIVSPRALHTYGNADYGNHPAGTGPFRMVSWTVGDRLVLEKNPDYWQPGVPKLDGIRFMHIQNATTLVTALLGGQIDYVAQIDPVNLPVLEHNPRVQVKVEPTIAWSNLIMNLDLKPFDNVLVRRALAYAIDRPALAHIAYGTVPAEPANLPVPPNYWPSSPDYVAYYTYQPDKAKQLLAEAGFPNGVPFQICASATSGAPIPGPKLIELLRAQVTRAGFTMQASMLASSAACIQLFNGERSMPSFLVSWTGRPSPYMTYQQNFGSTGPYNVSKTRFDGVDELLAKLQAIPDQAAQKPIFDQLNAAWIQDVPMIPLYYLPNVSVFSADLAGEVPNLLGKPDVTTFYFKH